MKPKVEKIKRQIASLRVSAYYWLRLSPALDRVRSREYDLAIQSIFNLQCLLADAEKKPRPTQISYDPKNKKTKERLLKRYHRTQVKWYGNQKKDTEVGLPLVFEEGSVDDPEIKKQLTFPWINFRKTRFE